MKWLAAFLVVPCLSGCTFDEAIDPCNGSTLVPAWTPTDEPAQRATSGDRQYLDYVQTFTGVCTHEHITVAWYIDHQHVPDCPGVDFQFSGRLDIGLFQEYDPGLAPRDSISGSGRTWQGLLSDIGLQQAFGEGPASFSVWTSIDAPAYIGDEVFRCLREGVTSQTEAHFHRYKP